MISIRKITASAACFARTAKPKYFFLFLFFTVLIGCQAGPGSDLNSARATEGFSPQDTDKLFVVDCLLPGQVRKLGTQMTYISSRRPIRTTAGECEIRGGEYVAYDRANFASALKVWLPQAQQGDAEAQVTLGEIYEKGLGGMADPALAAQWYLKAAEQGNSRAQVNLGYLYEKGLDKKDKGDQTIEIHNDRTVTLNEGNDTLTVKKGKRETNVDTGDNLLNVKQGNRVTTIDQGNDTKKVKMGDHSVKVDVGKSTTEAMTSIELKVGGNSIKIDQSGITIKGIMVTVQGDAKLDAKSPMTTVNGDGMLTLKGGITMIN